MTPQAIRKAVEVDSPLNDLAPTSAGSVRSVVTDQGVRVEILAPLLAGQRVAVDYCSITVSEDVVRRLMPDAQPFSDAEFCELMANYVCDHLLCKLREVERKTLPVSLRNQKPGPKITVLERPPYKHLDRGIFGYSAAIQIGNFGLVAAGGNGWTCYISLTGHAFACCDAGLCLRLYQFCNESPTARLTRIDLCHDDFEGANFNPHKMFDAWHEDKFTAERGNRKRPRLEKRGDWERGDEDNRGLTLYIGARTSGRLMRFYEKGKQLGDQSSPWCRAEIELRNNVFHLVSEMLINPTGYFIACSPVFALVALTTEPVKLDRIAREGIATVERVLEIIKTQYGVHLDVLRKEFFGTDAELLDAITRVGVVPPALVRALDLFEATEPA